MPPKYKVIWKRCAIHSITDSFGTFQRNERTDNEAETLPPTVQYPLSHLRYGLTGISEDIKT